MVASRLVVLVMLGTGWTSAQPRWRLISEALGVVGAARRRGDVEDVRGSLHAGRPPGEGAGHKDRHHFQLHRHARHGKLLIHIHGNLAPVRSIIPARMRAEPALQAYLRKKPANFVHQKPATEWSNERETRGIGIACAWNRALHA